MNQFDAIFNAATNYQPPRRPEPEQPNEPDVVNLGVDFWQARPELAHIRQAAQARTRSADAALGVVLARLAALTPPSVTLPAIVGSAGSLDTAVALIGPSGSGKSSAARLGAELVPILDDEVGVVPLGSGEGIIEAYHGMVTEEGDDGKNHKVKRQVRRSVLVMLDEGQALDEMGGRKGSTLLPTIRTAWSGDRLGQANASNETKRLLEPGEYRFALIAGFQTDHAVTLLDDAAGGTPQRLVYFAATDPTLPDTAPPWPGALQISLSFSAGPLDVAEAVQTEIRRHALAVARDEIQVAPLDAHRGLVRLKIAAVLGVLNGNPGVDAEDWQLAGEIVDASDRVRDSIEATAAAKARSIEAASIAKADRRSRVLGQSESDRARQTMARAIARHVHRGNCPEGCSRRCVSRSTSGKHRKLASVDEAVETAQSQGWITVDGDAYGVGEVVP